MSARAHGTDEPHPSEQGDRSPDEPAEVADATPPGPADAADPASDVGVAEPLTSASALDESPDAPSRAGVAVPAAGPGAGDAGDEGVRAEPEAIDAQWSDIVTRLREPSDPRGWAPDPEVEEAEDHFVPPDPGPVLGGDPLLTMAWSAVLGAALLVVIVAVAWRDAPTWVLQAAGAALLGGVGLLVWRMPHERDEDDDDPGAVV